MTSDLAPMVRRIERLLGIAQRQPLTESQARQIAALLTRVVARQAYVDGQLELLDERIEKLERGNLTTEITEDTE